MPTGLISAPRTAKKRSFGTTIPNPETPRPGRAIATRRATLPDRETSSGSERIEASLLVRIFSAGKKYQSAVTSGEWCTGNSRAASRQLTMEKHITRHLLTVIKKAVGPRGH